MKSKINPKQDYSIIIMRDDNKMRTFRIKRKTVSFLKLFAFILFALGVAGCIGALHYHERFRNLQARHSVQRQELIALKLQLEQFTNLRTLANNTNTAVMPMLNEELEEAPENSESLPYATTAEQAQPADVVTGDTALQGQELDKSLAGAEGQLSDGGTIEAAEGQLSEKAAAAVALPAMSEDPSPVRVNNFEANATGSERIVINYTLNTVEPKRTVGTASYGFIDRSGEMIDLPTRFGNGIKFIISHGRTMESSFNLGNDVKASDLAKILVFVTLEDGQKFVESFDVSFN